MHTQKMPFTDSLGSRFNCIRIDPLTLPIGDEDDYVINLLLHIVFNSSANRLRMLKKIVSYSESSCRGMSKFYGVY